MWSPSSGKYHSCKSPTEIARSHSAIKGEQRSKKKRPSSSSFILTVRLIPDWIRYSARLMSSKLTAAVTAVWKTVKWQKDTANNTWTFVHTIICRKSPKSWSNKSIKCYSWAQAKLLHSVVCTSIMLRKAARYPGCLLLSWNQLKQKSLSLWKV